MIYIIDLLLLIILPNHMPWLKNMLKKGPLGKKQLKNLYIFSSDKHPYEGQNPTKLEV